MLYMRFSPIGPDQWEASTISGPIAKVSLHGDGRCSVIPSDRAISREEMDSVSAFMQEQKRA